MEDGSEVAYVRLHYFTSRTSKAVQAALLSGEQDGVSGYIFDLRNNPGAVRGGAQLRRRVPSLFMILWDLRTRLSH